MRGMAAAIVREGLKPRPQHAIGWREPGRAERGKETRSGRRKQPKCSGNSRRTKIGAFRSASLRLPFRKNPKCSGKPRSGVENPERVDLLPEEAETHAGPPESFRKCRGSPNRPFRRPPSPPPRLPTSGDPRSFSGVSGSGSKAAPANPEAIPQPPERFRSTSGTSGNCQAAPEFAERFRSPPEVSETIPETREAIPEIVLKRFGTLRKRHLRKVSSGSEHTRKKSPETVPKRFRRSPRRFRKLPSDSGASRSGYGNSRSGSEAIPELPELSAELPRKLPSRL